MGKWDSYRLELWVGKEAEVGLGFKFLCEMSYFLSVWKGDGGTWAFKMLSLFWLLFSIENVWKRAVKETVELIS